MYTDALLSAEDYFRLIQVATWISLY